MILSNLAFGSPKRTGTDIESGLRLVRTLPDESTIITRSLGPALSKSASYPSAMATHKQLQLEGQPLDVAGLKTSLKSGPIDLCTRPIVRVWLYFLIFLKFAMYTLLSLCFNGLLSEISVPLSLGYIFYAEVLFMTWMRRFWTLLRRDCKP